MSARQGWYEDTNGVMRYWDGEKWGMSAEEYRSLTSEQRKEGQALNSGAAAVKKPSMAVSDLGGYSFSTKKISKISAYKDAVEIQQQYNSLLAAVVDSGGLEAIALIAKSESAENDLRALEAKLEATQGMLAQSEDIFDMQEVAIYEYRHDIDTSVKYQSAIKHVRDRKRSAAKDIPRSAAERSNWSVSESRAKGKKMVKDFMTLMLKSYNSQLDIAVTRMQPYKLNAYIDRMNKTKESIDRLGSVIGVEIPDYYHNICIQEMELQADYLEMKEEEKELIRQQREREREEEQTRKELERAKDKYRHEMAKKQELVNSLRAQGREAEAVEYEEELVEIAEAMEDMNKREANTRSGYVYVISNIGSFGKSIVKIGMTRRLNPMDRVNELGDASVPFKFDVHALHFSEDAVALEGRLHKAFAKRKVNLVNNRKEFFFATPAEVKQVLMKVDGTLREFTEAPEAVEYFQSKTLRERLIASSNKK